jgi:hypothetical protein
LRSSDRKLKPLPPDPFRHQHSAIALTYQESASFTQNGGAFVLDLLSNDALGIGFDSAAFKIFLASS